MGSPHVIVRQSFVPRRIYVFPRHPRTSSVDTFSYTLVFLDAPRWMLFARLGSQLDVPRTRTSHVQTSCGFHHVHVQPTTTSMDLLFLPNPPFFFFFFFLKFFFGICSCIPNLWTDGMRVWKVVFCVGVEKTGRHERWEINKPRFIPIQRMQSMGSRARNETPEHIEKEKVGGFATTSRESRSNGRRRRKERKQDGEEVEGTSLST